MAGPGLSKDGRRLSLEFTITLVEDEAGQILGAAAILRDVTARWQRDRELQRRLADLEAQLKRVGRASPPAIPRQSAKLTY